MEMTGHGITVEGIIKIVCVGRSDLQEEFAKDVVILKEGALGIFHFSSQRSHQLVTVEKYRDEDGNLLVKYSSIKKELPPPEPTRNGYLYLFCVSLHIFVLITFSNPLYLFLLTFPTIGPYFYLFKKIYKILVIGTGGEESDLKCQIERNITELTLASKNFSIFHYNGNEKFNTF